MQRFCPLCEQRFKEGELVKLTILAEYKELKSKVHYSVGHPLDADPASLTHADCLANAGIEGEPAENET